jgi:hypothetical protein
MKNLTTKKLMAILVTSVLASLVVPYALGTSSTPTPVLPSQCITTAAGWNVNPTVNASWSTHPIVNAKLSVINDEAPGRYSYWALQNYGMNIVIWQNTATSPNTFCALVQDSGTWTTFAGAQSPGNNVTEPKKGSGSYFSSNLIAFTGVFLGPYCVSTTKHPCTPGSTVPTTGKVPGKFNLGGSETDVLTVCGNIVCNQVGDTNTALLSPYGQHWYLKLYFSSATFSSGWNQGFSYTYIYGNGLGYGHMWADWSMGDIVT